MTTDVTSKAAGKATSTTASPVPKLSFSKVVSVSIPSFPFNSAVKSLTPPAKSTGRRSSELTSPPPLSNLRNPYLGETSLEYNELGQFDQLIYSLQKGAPVHGKTLPLPWQTVKQTLFDFGEITLDGLNSEEATKWLQLRYECLRLGIEAFFKSKPETADKNDWTLFQYEGFDAFDKNPGSKYWKHRGHSIFNPSTTSINDDEHEPMEIAETDDENEARGGQEEATPYNQFNAVEDQLTLSATEHSELEGCITNNDELEGDSNRVGGRESQEAETTIIDHEDWTNEDETLVETMQGEELLSSKGLMSHEELGETIANFLDEPLSNPHIAKVTSPRLSNTKSEQPIAPSYEAPESACTTQTSPAYTFLSGFQAINKVMEGNLPNKGIPLPVKRSKSEKQLQNRRLRSRYTRTLQEEPQTSSISSPIIHHHLVQISQRRTYKMRLSTPAKVLSGHLKPLDTIGVGGRRPPLSVLFLVALPAHSLRAPRLANNAALCFQLLQSYFGAELQFARLLAIFSCCSIITVLFGILL